MARVTRVEVSRGRDGWDWVPTDAQGRVRIGVGKRGYSRRADAVRGARRACGATVRIAYA